MLKLRKRDADPVFFPPNDPASAAHLIGSHNQVKLRWNADRALDGKSRTGIRQVADCAVYRPTAELNCSSFEDTLSECNSMFAHEPNLPFFL